MTFSCPAEDMKKRPGAQGARVIRDEDVSPPCKNRGPDYLGAPSAGRDPSVRPGVMRKVTTLLLGVALQMAENAMDTS